MRLDGEKQRHKERDRDAENVWPCHAHLLKLTQPFVSNCVARERGSDGGRRRDRDTEREMRVQYKCTQMVFVRRAWGQLV